MFDTAGFHEAVGDTIALSVSTPQHLQKVGLLENYEDTEEDNINALMQIALQKVLRQTERQAYRSILHIYIYIYAKHIKISNLYTYMILHDYLIHNNNKGKEAVSHNFIQ
jgi:hypothetical protein